MVQHKVDVTVGKDGGATEAGAGWMECNVWGPRIVQHGLPLIEGNFAKPLTSNYRLLCCNESTTLPVNRALNLL